MNEYKLELVLNSSETIFINAESLEEAMVKFMDDNFDAKVISNLKYDADLVSIGLVEYL